MNTKRVRVALFACAVMLLPPGALASEVLAKKHGCTSCHQAEQKTVGPSWKQIADKYKGGAPAKLAASIKAGSSNKWGPIPMPPQPLVGEADLQTLAGWILSR